ncbi:MULTISPECIES: MFS transporter [unclassified Nonomuraea]|uniref:MFS transporter n=1 Tax=unclassified Nonomuraea TaxID=2593643 RepID=UPI0034086325
MPAIWNDRSSLASPAFIVLAGSQVVLIASITLLVVPLPAVQREFGMDPADLALLNSAYGLSFSGLLLLGGRLGDLYGHRRAFLAGVAVFGVASAAAALAPGNLVLLVARFAQGVGAALTAPAAMALVRQVVPEERRPRATAVWGTLSVTGATAGSLLSGVIAALVSWRWAFAIPIAASAVVVAAARLLPGRAAGGTPGRAPRLDVPGAVLATAGMVTLSFGLLYAAPIVAGAGGLLLLAFAAVELRAAEPLLPLGFLASPRRPAALVAVLVTAAASATTTFFLTLWLQQVRGLTPLQTSAAFAPYLLVLAMGPVSGRLVGRLGARAVTVCGLGLGALSMGLLSLIEPGTPYAGVVLAGLLLFPVASGLALSGATVTALDGVPARQAGLGAGLVNTAMEVGPTVGLAALAALAAARTGPHRDPAAVTHGYGFALAVTALLFVLTAALTGIAGRSPRNENTRNREDRHEVRR